MRGLLPEPRALHHRQMRRVLFDRREGRDHRRLPAGEGSLFMRFQTRPIYFHQIDRLVCLQNSALSRVEPTAFNRVALAGNRVPA